MMRALYLGLMLLHPPAFRRQFAGEMLWIFDEAAQSEGVATLFLDGIASLLRQWILRTGSWKIALAIAGAALQVSIAGALMLRIGREMPHNVTLATENPALVELMRLGAATAVGLLAVVLLLVIWWRSMIPGRRAHLRGR